MRCGCCGTRIVRAVMPHVAGLRTNPSRTSQKIWIFLKHEDAADNDDESDDEKNALRAELSNRFAMKRNLNGLFEAEEKKEERRGEKREKREKRRKEEKRERERRGREKREEGEERRKR